MSKVPPCLKQEGKSDARKKKPCRPMRHTLFFDKKQELPHKNFGDHKDGDARYGDQTVPYHLPFNSAELPAPDRPPPSTPPLLPNKGFFLGIKSLTNSLPPRCSLTLIFQARHGGMEVESPRPRSPQPAPDVLPSSTPPLLSREVSK